MYNPFKNTYKIIELSRLSGDNSFIVIYGNIFIHQKLRNDGILVEYSDPEFETLDDVKSAIRLHQENLLANRLKKTTTKVIARI